MRAPAVTAPLRAVPRDGALLLFDPGDGTNVLVRGSSTRALRARAPRVVMFAPTNACNLRCEFCSRERGAASRWDEESAFGLLAALSAAGVLEVALGGGEPLVFRGLEGLLARLAAETSLAVHLTTNGALLDERRFARIRPLAREIRLSIYDEQPWSHRMAMLAEAGGSFGANVLVTRDRVPALPGLLARLEELGCPDVAFLRYVGPDPTLALDDSSIERVGEIARRTSMRVRVSVCFGHELGLPFLDTGSSPDCGAGGDFVVVSSDSTVRACSFASESIPFTSPADVIAIWRRERALLEARVDALGCARGAQMFRDDDGDGVRMWRAFSGNNSGDCFLVGKFGRAAEAERFVAELREGYVAGEPVSRPWRELLAREGVGVRPSERMPERLEAIGRAVLAHTAFAVDDDFPSLRARLLNAGGRSVGAGVHEHAAVHLLSAIAAEDAHVLDELEVRAAVDELGSFIREGDVLYGICGLEPSADETFAWIRQYVASGATASAELVAGDHPPPLATALAARSSEPELEWLRVHTRSAGTAARLAGELGPSAASGGRLVLARAPSVSDELRASRLGDAVAVLEGDELHVEVSLWRAPRAGEDPPMLEADAIERELRAGVGAEAHIEGPLDLFWQSITGTLTTRSPLTILPFLAAFAAARDLQVEIDVRSRRPFERALARLDADVRAIRRERRAR